MFFQIEAAFRPMIIETSIGQVSTASESCACDSFHYYSFRERRPFRRKEHGMLAWRDGQRAGVESERNFEEVLSGRTTACEEVDSTYHPIGRFMQNEIGIFFFCFMR